MKRLLFMFLMFASLSVLQMQAVMHDHDDYESGVWAVKHGDDYTGGVWAEESDEMHIPEKDLMHPKPGSDEMSILPGEERKILPGQTYHKEREILPGQTRRILPGQTRKILPGQTRHILPGQTYKGGVRPTRVGVVTGGTGVSAVRPTSSAEKVR